MEFLRTNRGKIIFTAFVGIQIPILALTYYIWLSSVFFTKQLGLDRGFGIISILSITFLADVITTSGVIYALYYLLTSASLKTDIEGLNLTSSFLDSDWLDLGNIEGAIVTQDLSKRKCDRLIQHLIHYDTLTGLPNRQLFQTYVVRAIEQTDQSQQFAIVVLDLNSLKSINSTLGRQVGDLLLTEVAQRLKSYLQKNDTLARFGGDEFVILRTNITNSDCSIALSNQLLGSLSQPFSLHGKDIHCDAKIGITTYPFDGVTVEQLLQNADTAIYQAKSLKLNTYQFYSPVTKDKLNRSLAIKENLRYALAKEELSLYYQPRIEIATNRLVGVEALLRWYNPQLGWVSPDEFIPIAEETSLIMPIGEWVLDRACLQNKQWQEAKLSPIQVSVNLSAYQFKQKNLVETINRILDRTGLDTVYLELEITESLLLEDLDRAIATLWELKLKGISIALDDFGTGYSSLSYLQRLPLNTLKLDRSFVKNIASNTDDAAISSAIVALAQSLKLKITAEGVETKAQLNYLQDRGCNEAQGYYFSQPLPSDRIVDFLVAQRFIF